MRRRQVTSRPPRLVGLDVSRGLLILTSVTMVAVLEPRPAQLQHSSWEGLTVFDALFPIFVALSGCGMAFAYRKHVPWRTTIKRSLVLLATGLIYNWILRQPESLSELRFTGPLQVYAVLLIVVHPLHLLLRTRWYAWAGFTVVAGAAWAGFWWWAGRGCPDGVVSAECNPTLPFEALWMGWEHLYRQGERGFEPEGLIGIMGALITCVAGTTAGHILLRWRGKPRAVLVLGGWTLVSAGAGLALQPLVPFLKWMWSPSYGLVTASFALALLTLTSLLLDTGGPGPRDPPLRLRLATPLIALGRNALLVYFGSHAVMGVLNSRGDPPRSQQIAETVGIFDAPRLSFVLLSVIAWWVLALVLHRFRIYVKP